jgi:hypothetical protein
MGELKPQTTRPQPTGRHDPVNERYGDLSPLICYLLAMTGSKGEEGAP